MAAWIPRRGALQPHHFEHRSGLMQYHEQPVMDGHYDRFGNYHHG